MKKYSNQLLNKLAVIGRMMKQQIRQLTKERAEARNMVFDLLKLLEETDEAFLIFHKTKRAYLPKWDKKIQKWRKQRELEDKEANQWRE